MKKQTLHQCNWNEISDFSFYCQLIDVEKDELLIYADEICSDGYNKIMKTVTKYQINVSIILVNNFGNIPTISHQQWVELTEKFEKIYTWK